MPAAPAHSPFCAQTGTPPRGTPPAARESDTCASCRRSSDARRAPSGSPSAQAVRAGCKGLSAQKRRELACGLWAMRRRDDAPVDVEQAWLLPLVGYTVPHDLRQYLATVREHLVTQRKRSLRAEISKQARLLATGVLADFTDRVTQSLWGGARLVRNCRVGPMFKFRECATSWDTYVAEQLQRRIMDILREQGFRTASVNCQPEANGIVSDDDDPRPAAGVPDQSFTVEVKLKLPRLPQDQATYELPAEDGSE